MSNAPAIWTPKTFKGSDLLPVNRQETALVEKEEVVGMENIEASDLIVPRLKLLAGTSDEVQQGLPGAAPGKFLLTATRRVLEPPLRGLIVFHSKSRALFPQTSRPETAGLERCVSQNYIEGSVYGMCAICQHKEWPGVKGQSPACSEAHNFVLLTPDGPHVLRFSRTTYKAGRTFVSEVLPSGKNWWAHPVIITTKFQENGAKKWYSMDMFWDRSEATPVEFRAMARATFDQLKAAHDAGRLDTGAGEDEADNG